MIGVLRKLKEYADRFGLLEFKTLLVIFVLAIALMGFEEIADGAMEGDTHAIDSFILLMFRMPGNLSDPIGPLWLEEIVADISALGGIALLTLFTLLSTFYMIIIGRWRKGLYVAFTVITGTVLSNLLKSGFDRPRPDLIPHDIHVYTASFPSGHSMMAAVVYLTLGALLAQAHEDRHVKAYFMAAALFFTAIIGISRVYLGVHWPTDVLAGWCIGAFWALLCWGLEIILHRRFLSKSA